MGNLDRLLLFLLLLHRFLRPISAVDLLFNGFNPSDLLLYGGSTLDSAGSLRYLSLTEASPFSVGRALYKSKIPTKNATTALSFSTSFLFSIAPIRGTLPGHGIAFLFSPVLGTQVATAAQHLGLFNRTTDGDRSNGVLAVEFDVFENQEFNDIDANHVGIDLFSLTSTVSHTAGYWPDTSPSSFVELKLNDGSNYQAWVEYSGGKLNVTMAKASLSKKPLRPLISVDLDLSTVFKDEMYIGFCAATGRLVENHRILDWSFSNSNFSLSEALITSGLPSFVPEDLSSSSRKKALIAGLLSTLAALLVIGSVVCLFVFRRGRQRRRRRWREELLGVEESGNGDAPLENWELEYWPHRIGYREILSGTEAFSDQNLIGSGGNGRVYKGTIGGAAVAVKLFSRSTGEEARAFLVEVSSLGRLKHRNLVGLKGWCRKAGGDLILIYEYMENGSLDKRIFEEAGVQYPPLDWTSRVRILKDVAAGVLYLHEGWESKVLHRDIKASNVMLGGDMVGRLGDFGLARIQPHGGAPRTTRVVGTVGYMAPEVMRSGKATVATDVYGFGVLVLEVVCGRRPVVEGSPPLIEWAWGMVERGEVAAVVDPRVKTMKGFDEEEAGRVVRLGLICTCRDPAGRPTMREVVRALDGGWMAEEQGVDGGSGEVDDDRHGKSAEMYLLEKLKTAVAPAAQPWMASKMKCCYNGALRNDPNHHHPTFEELRQSMSGSLSASDLITEGR